MESGGLDGTAETPHTAGTGNETLSTQSPSSEFSLGVLVLLAFLMVLLALVTILGNILVILAFIMDRNLRHRSNYFFLNLAISDFAVGAFCMPLYIPYSLTGKWYLGRGICKLWLVMDYLLCTASVFNIVLISYDRFLSVTKAVSYRAQQGITSNPVVKMVAIWVFAFLLYCPAILFWEHVAGHSVVAADQCYAEFFDNWYFLLCASTLEFFVPLLSVAYFNMHIFHDIQRQSLITENLSPSRGNSVTPENDFSVSFCSRTGSKLQQDKKIAKSLAIIVCAFAICWAPYTLLMIIRGACQGTCVHNSLYEITFWLLWLNSSLNPFLYPLCHVKFRMAFMKILCPKKFATLRSGFF
uniref:G-protein coupled receptors family 1 profile domain-containing protein n=1 Tax=Aquila chrysaetos chrysaetos TaxID=223781 RepID=A0A663E8V9_AQUCH